MKEKSLVADRRKMDLKRVYTYDEIFGDGEEFDNTSFQMQVGYDLDLITGDKYPKVVFSIYPRINSSHSIIIELDSPTSDGLENWSQVMLAAADELKNIEYESQ